MTATTALTDLAPVREARSMAIPSPAPSVALSETPREHRREREARVSETPREHRREREARVSETPREHRREREARVSETPHEHRAPTPSPAPSVALVAETPREHRRERETMTESMAEAQPKQPKPFPPEVLPGEGFALEGHYDENAVQYYKDVDLDFRFLPMQKVDNLYVAPLAEALRVQTPPVVLTGDVRAPEARLVARGSFKHFATGVEQAIVDAAILNKATWFKKEITDEALVKGFKSFVSGKGMKVKLDDDLVAFDADGDIVDFDDLDTPVSVRCIIELDGVCFGRKEFGAMWTVTQMQVARLPRCAITNEKSSKFGGQFA